MIDLADILIQEEVIDADTSKSVEQYAKEHNISYEDALIEKGADVEKIRNAVAEHFDLPAHAILKTDRIEPKVLHHIPEESARHYGAIPLKIEDGVLVVGVTDPEDLALKDALNFITSRQQVPYKLVVILEQDLKNGLRLYENLTGEVDEALVELETELTPEEKKVEEAKEAEVEHIKEDAPVTKIVATILRYAVDGMASDIHIEPSDERITVRFRVDGVLSTSLELPPKVHKAVVARVKILASLRLDEKRKPQDGRFSATIDKRKIDFRVSILPTNHGEKVVMRILDTEQGVKSLEGTGVSDYNLKLIRDAVREPYGIILVSGPTGSGKSTTLYAMLGEIDKKGRNVLSLEDPVEYDIAGVSQSQVRPEIGYTFANGLRTALRQDPDVILVGEIRDKETAQLAIQAALTGHLVLSTIHTNNAIGVIPRLIDMGVDPYLIAPTLRLALAQRLVRKICPGTGKKKPIEGSIKMMLDTEFGDLPEEHRHLIPDAGHVLFAESTPECANGTKGRTAVMEAVVVNEEVESLILNGGEETKLREVARKNGFINMKEDAIIKSLKHEIPFEEVGSVSGAMLISDEAEKEMEELPVDNPPTDET